MNQDVDELSLHDMYKKHILKGEDLLQKLHEHYFFGIKGIHKLHRKIKRDIIFFTETLQSNKMKKEHLICTNLHFYKAVVEESLKQSECEAVLETYSYMTCDCQKRLTVDVVSFKGKRWTKVVARNPVALHHIYKDGDSFGRKSIMDQATSYLEAASQNLHLFCPPEVVFSFVNGVPDEMKGFLERKGVLVEGNVISFERESACGSSTDSDDEDATCSYDINAVFPVKQKTITKLNLCVTTMIAYVSSLTNGGCNSRFMEPLLNQQAEWERNQPVKPLLINLFKGKELISCFTAVEDFKNIIDMVGGEKEKSRAGALLSIIEIVADVPFPGLRSSGKIKKRSLLIFGTGHEHKAVTITANKGFVHASKQKGVKFAVIIHESRALTERKELIEHT